MAIDQAHEQNNAKVKEQGGAIGLTQDPSGLLRWTLGGPEVVRLLSEFKSEEEGDKRIKRLHHEQYPAYQKKFMGKVVSLKDSFLESGNPFEEKGPHLFALDTRILAGDFGVATFLKMEEKGLKIYHEFVQERLIEKKKSIFEKIKRVSASIFHPNTENNKQKQQSLKEKSLQTDVQLFSRLFIVSNARNLDLDTFFQFENQPFPPSLAQNGSLRPGNKADLIHILEGKIG